MLPIFGGEENLSVDMIPVILNGTKVSARSGMTILELARENGVDIPTLCYRPMFAWFVIKLTHVNCAKLLPI